MHHKIIAYLLILVGLTTLFFSFTAMYQTFVHRRPVVQVLQLQPISVSTQYGVVQVQADAINSIVNLSLFALFMIFLVGIGSKVAAIGNNLLKTERICQTLLELRKEEVLSGQEQIKKL